MAFVLRSVEATMRTFIVFFSLAILSACSEGSVIVVDKKPPPAPRRVEGLPSEGLSATSTTVMTSSTPMRLTTIDGTLAAVWPSQVARLNSSGMSMTNLAVGASGESMSLGEIKAVAHRTNGGAFFLSDAGIFHSAAGQLLRAPVSDSIADFNPQTLDSLGADGGEELWLSTSQSVLWVASRELNSIVLSDEGRAVEPTGAVGIAPGRVLLIAGSAAFELDVPSRKAKKVATGLGSVTQAERGADDSIALATSEGLFVRAPNGEFTQYTFAAAGEAPRTVQAVSTSTLLLTAAVDGSLVRVDGAGARKVGQAAVAQAGGVVHDSHGDTFAIDGAKLVRFVTPISFAADIVPLLQQHCTRCHLPGGSQTQVEIDLLNHSFASANAQLLLNRLNGNPTLMPPLSANDVLSANDIALLGRWIDGGKLP